LQYFHYLVSQLILSIYLVKVFNEDIKEIVSKKKLNKYKPDIVVGGDKITSDNDVAGGIINVKSTSYIAFGLIAVMLLASIAMAFIVMIKDGADTGTLMTLGILAIGVSVILIVGFIIMNSVAIGVIAGI